jgi:arsenate reductase (thioredoxin)
MSKPFILILCTGNSCRSQMAEGILRRELGDFADVASAGSRPAGFVHPTAVEVMREIGIDISAARSKPIAEFLDGRATTVITVCADADAACPVFPGKVRRRHFGFDDPAKAAGDDAAIRAEFRRVRDDIDRMFVAYAAGLLDGAATVQEYG